MSVAVRVILALMLVVQSLPGMAVERCEAMARCRGTAAAHQATAEDDDCPCCSPRGCSDRDAVIACRCGTPRPEQPKAPPSESKTRLVQFDAAIVAAVVGCSSDAAGEPALHRGRLGALPQRPANSIQSVLCVWVV